MSIYSKIKNNQKNRLTKHFAGKTVYITGGASGLGLESAQQLAKLGANLVLFDISPFDKVLSQIENSQKSNSQFIITQHIDVTNAEQVMNVVAEVAKQTPPDICMHFAGITSPWTFDNITHEQFDNVITINLKGTFNWLKAIRPFMSKGKQAMVTSSIAGLVGSYGYSSYSASKFGVLGMMQAIRTEWKPLGIDVTVFAPPHIDTPMTEWESSRLDKNGYFLKMNAGKLNKTDAIATLLNGMANKSFIVIPGFKANLLALELRYIPQPLINKITDIQLLLAQKLHG